MVLAVILIIILVRGGFSRPAGGGDLARATEYANSLLNNELYRQAIDQFEAILADYNPDASRTANIIYQMGNIYFEDLKDYQGALQAYLKLKTYFPDSPLMSETNKKIVGCLDRLGRSAQARQALDQAVVLGQSTPLPSGGKTLAKIGDRKITARELNAALNKLPENMLEEFKGPEGQYRFLQSYVAQELMYNMALRRGYDKEQEYIDNLNEMQKQLLIQLVYQDEVGEKLEINPEDVKFYYQQHQEEFKDKSPEQAYQEIGNLLYMQKSRIMEQELIKKMTEAEGVSIFPDSLGVIIE